MFMHKNNQLKNVHVQNIVYGKYLQGGRKNDQNKQ